MRRNKEIMILLGLFVGMMGFVLWYVINRRAKNQAEMQSVAPAVRK